MGRSLLQASLQVARGLRQIVGVSWLGRSISWVTASSHGLILMCPSPNPLTQVSTIGMRVDAAAASYHFHLILPYIQLSYFKESHLRCWGLGLKSVRLERGHRQICIKALCELISYSLHSTPIGSLSSEVSLIISSRSSGVLVYLTENNAP